MHFHSADTILMNRFSLFLLASIAIHLAFYCSVYLLPKIQKPKNETIEVTFEAATEVKPQLDTDRKNRQIVDQDDQALNQETPDKDYFLSKNNQKVAKQTVAKDKGEFKNTKSKKSAGKNATTPQSLDQAKRPEKFNPLSDVSTNFKEKSFKTIVGSTPSSSAASSQTQDYLKNTDIGVETILSTKEFKYYTYFNRIRKQLSEHWEPKVRDKLTKMFRQGRSIASNQDRTTKLLIILNPEGVLVKVQLVSDSGVKDLDEAAIESFRSAAPFPNPPKGIVDPDGTVKIRWDFILES